MIEKHETLKTQILHLKQFLGEKGYASRSIKRYESCWNSLIRYAELRMIDVFSDELGNDYLNAGGTKFQEPDNIANKQDVHGIKLLCSFLKDQFIITTYILREPIAPQPYLEVTTAYILFMQSIDQTNSTIKSKRSRIKVFCEYLYNAGIQALNDISKLNIVNFMDWLSSRYTSVARGNILYTVKDFLLFCERERYIETKLSHLIKGIYTNSNETLPSTYTQEEVALLLSSVDRTTSSGKKRYAILVLAAQLGMRAFDIISITIDDIKWNQSIIEFYQRKTGKHVQLPLIDSVKFALLDYLKNNRPATEHKQLFLRETAPIEPYKVSSTIYKIVSEQFKIAGISTDGKRRGSHSLRHSLASSLLEEETPLPVIASALGHQNTKNTNRYLRIDIGQLRKVALEVPV